MPDNSPDISTTNTIIVHLKITQIIMDIYSYCVL